ncbi:MAG TPA: hypothetical protein PKW55_05655 [Spirochaetota bacterium]|nr:hypothetical protein [Spirochaetota bacterium]HOM37563.1 hypothetical protein [Spirochaetota bacterium]HPQ49466.1 hypothetical protein [Spirochaetota bacterium]
MVIKKFLFLLSIVFSINLYSSSVFLAKMGVEQGFIFNKPKNVDLDLDATNSINAYFAYKDNLIGLDTLFVYNLDYNGPGIKGYSSGNFTSRSFDNYFLTKFFYPIDNTVFEFKLDFLYEFYNIGNEKWTEGLYNFGKTGIGSSLTYNLSPKLILGSGVNISYVWFPNYTDLETEAINLIEGVSGSVKQNFWQFDFDASIDFKSFLLLIFEYSLIYRIYPDLYVNSVNIMSKENQYDFINMLKFNAVYQKYDFSLELSINFINYNSNYNYRKIIDYSTLQIDFNKDYLDYNSIEFSLSLLIFLSSSSTISITPNIGYKSYSARHPSKNDGSGALDYSKTEWDLYYGLSLAYDYKNDDVFSFKPVYVLRIGKSNNNDLLLNNNYVSNYFGFEVTFEY